MGFIRKQEEKWAMHYIVWSCQKNNYPLPDATQLKQMTSQLVDEAHRIARERGSNVISIVKDLVKEIMAKNKSS